MASNHVHLIQEFHEDARARGTPSTTRREVQAGRGNNLCTELRLCANKGRFNFASEIIWAGIRIQAKHLEIMTLLFPMHRPISFHFSFARVIRSQGPRALQRANRKYLYFEVPRSAQHIRICMGMRSSLHMRFARPAQQGHQANVVSPDQLSSDRTRKRLVPSCGENFG